MPERSPCFLGLTRPARYFGLPVAYFAVWSMGSFLLYIPLRTFWLILPVVFFYIMLRILAEREPRFFEMVAIALSKTPRTRNRAYWGGDSYGP